MLDILIKNDVGTGNDRVGLAVGVNRRSVVIGADGAERLRGRATVYARQSGQAGPEQSPSLAASVPADGDLFGFATAISEDPVLFGAPGGAGAVNDTGAAYLFSRAGTQWTQKARLVLSKGAAMDSFGSSVAISDATILAGAPNRNGGQGSVFVFAGSGGVWSQQSELQTQDGAAGDRFGSSVRAAQQQSRLPSRTRRAGRSTATTGSRPSNGATRGRAAS